VASSRKKSITNAIHGANIAIFIALVWGCSVIHDFSYLDGATRIDVRTNLDKPIKTISDPAQIQGALAFVKQRKTGWGSPWYGPPVPQVVLNFYIDNRYLGGYGIGSNFLATNPEPFLSRSITVGERDEIMQLLGVDFKWQY
jgi:hypothetical protein